MTTKKPDPGGPAAGPGAFPVVVFVHVFYQDVWQEIAAQLSANLALPFRLVVTTPHEPATIMLPESPWLASATVYHVENRGRDILPFLTALDAEASSFDVGLKLHTKRSPHRADGDAWRRAIFGSLLASSDSVAQIVSAFHAHPHLGLVAPEGLLLPLRDRLNDNRRVINAVGRAVGEPLTRSDIARGHFPAGSMFWFRRNALMGFPVGRVGHLFASETEQLDATAAHAIERMVAVSAEKRGYVALPADALASAHGIRDPAAARALSAQRPISPHAWQPPHAVLLVLRWVPLAGWTLRRLPQPVRHLIRRIVTGKP